jgi:polygalacturonase
MKSVYVLAVMLFALPGYGVGDAIFRVTDYGAVPDGVTLSTAGIQRAVDACAASGGGTVLFDKGRFVSGTIYLKSGVELKVAEKAVLLGSTNLEDYPVTIPDYRSYTDNYTERSLIYAEDAEDIAITGAGMIDGQGGAFKGEWKVRPYLIRVITSEDIAVRDIRLRNSPMWMQHYLACDNITIRNISVYNHCNKNNDMIDIDGCRNVLIEDCKGDTDDDGITLKSTSARPCENVIVRGCTVSSHCNAIKCGTESNGGFINITIEDCRIQPSVVEKPLYGRSKGLAGIALEIVDGGRMQNVTVSDISVAGTLSPIFLRLGDRARPFRKGDPRPDTGVIRNVTLRNITATGASVMGCPIAGLPGHPIEQLRLENLDFTFAGGGTAADIARKFDEKARDYPECKMFAPRLPAFGLFFWHVEDLTLSNIRLRTAKEDARPAMVFEDTAIVTLDRKAVTGPEDLPENMLMATP